MSKKKQTAKDIVEYLLEKTGTALFAGDFDAFSSCFSLPQEIHTFEGVQVLSTIDDIRRVFENVRAFHHKHGVTDLVRHCVEAEFHDPETIHSVHESRLLSGVRLLQKPYPVFTVSRFMGGRWQKVRSEYAVTDAPDLSAALHDNPNDPTG